MVAGSRIMVMAVTIVGVTAERAEAEVVTEAGEEVDTVVEVVVIGVEEVAEVVMKGEVVVVATRGEVEAVDTVVVVEAAGEGTASGQTVPTSTFIFNAIFYCIIAVTTRGFLTSVGTYPAALIRRMTELTRNIQRERAPVLLQMGNPLLALKGKQLTIPFKSSTKMSSSMQEQQ